MKRGEVLSGTVIKVVRNYNAFLNEKDQNKKKNIFKGVLSYCDVDNSPENEEGDEYLDIVE